MIVEYESVLTDLWRKPQHSATLLMDFTGVEDTVIWCTPNIAGSEVWFRFIGVDFCMLVVLKRPTAARQYPKRY